jgi:UDP-glucose 4-epimerase
VRLDNAAVLVIGGAGFIGSHLVDLLVQRAPSRIVVVDTLWLGREDNLRDARATHDDVVLLKENAEDYFALRAIVERERFDIVFNLATRPLNYSFVHPRGAYMTSVDIAANLADLLRSGAYGRLVNFSTSEVYGDAVETPMTEAHPTRPSTPYAAGKLAADLLLQSYVSLFALPVLTVRPFNNYGPRQNEGDYSAVIPLTVRRILAGDAPVIEGTGSQTRDFTFVRDTARLTLGLTECDAAWGQTFNVAAGREVAIEQLIGTIARLLGYTGPIDRRPPRAGDHRRHLGDSSRARALVPFDPLTPLDDGLAETIESYRRGARGPSSPR